jgi:microcystin-dependent protein
MSQNDLVIANQTFPATRADITSALQALGSTNSGPSAPSTTYANMMWYDTTSNILKIRAEANDAWISIGYLDQSAQRFEPENAVPTGAVNTFAMNSAPTGWLSCDGSLISRTTYSGLFSVVGTLYGVGDGSTTFNLPDLRGEFIRGFDAGRGVDSGRSFGTAQADELKSHSHTISAPSFGTGSDHGWRDVTQSFNTRTTSSTGGTETRPRNIALLYCIKY